METEDPLVPKAFKVLNRGDTKVVHIHNRYELTSSSPLFHNIDHLISLLSAKHLNDKRAHLHEVTKYTYFPTFEFLLQKVQPHKEMCCICQFEYQLHPDFQEQASKCSPSDIVSIGRCQHLFHKECLENFVGKKSFMKCPVCSDIYGIITGDQPEGTMSVTRNKMALPGYETVGTLIITYNMSGGMRNGNHFSGTSRTGYLPDTPEGQKVLKLLRTAFDRKLVFTVGRSVTTGMDNVIVWNGIHHKTSTNGGSSHFGYPDATYLYRVREELAAKGIY